MVLVFIILGIIILALLIFTILLLSTIKVEIDNLKIESKKQAKYLIKISIKFLGKIPIISIKIDNSKKIRKINFSNVKSKMNGKILAKEIVLEIIKKIKLEKLSLKAYIGTEDAILTSYIVASIASIIGVILPHIANKEPNQYEYFINPIYQYKNEYHITLNGIFCIKIVHIIYSLICFMKKRRDDKNERTSNRRSYAYSNE